MLKKIISHVSFNKIRKADNFFDLPENKRREIIKKAAELSVLDQKKLLKEYECKFGNMQEICKDAK